MEPASPTIPLQRNTQSTSKFLTSCKDLQKLSLKCLEKNYGEAAQCGEEIEKYKACIQAENEAKIAARGGRSWF